MNRMKKLVHYMKSRAAFEGVEWSLTGSFLQQSFDQGIRTFFGVDVDEKGDLLADSQQPDFFETYHRKMRSGVRASVAVSDAFASVQKGRMAKKKKPKKLPRGDEKVLRLAHEILIKKIDPAKLSLDEAIDVVAFVAKAIVLSNTADDDPEDRAGMIAWIEERFIEVLSDIDPSTDHAHAWFVSPQGLITEPIGILWSGTHEEDSVQVVLGAELASFRAELSEMKDAPEVHVIEGIEGVAITDPDWDGSPTVTCANPDCGKVHDVHLMVAENLFERAKQSAEQQSAPN